MTKKDYITLAQFFAKGYSEIYDPEIRTGYNQAIKDFMRYAAGQNPSFNALKFAKATYGIRQSPPKTNKLQKSPIL